MTLTKETQPISDAEWELMRIVWADSPLTSREIIDRLCDILPWKEGTIKSLINRLVQKGHLMKIQDTSPFLYQARISQFEANRAKLDEQWTHICNRETGKLLGYLIDSKDLSRQDIDTLIQKLENKRPNAPDTLQCSCPPGQCHCQHEA